MAQILKPNRKDNRGGHKPKTSIKIMFTYRIFKEEREKIVQFIKGMRK